MRQVLPQAVSIVRDLLAFAGTVKRTRPAADRLTERRQTCRTSSSWTRSTVPMAYKDIDEVMAAQSDLVQALARFDPRLVKMAPSGEPPED